MNSKLPEYLLKKINLPQFNTINDIPWLFPNSDYYLMYWQAKLQELVKSYHYRIAMLEAQSQNEKKITTQERLKKIKKAQEYNLKKIEELMNPLIQQKASLELKMNDLIPSQQTLSLYWNNIFRDWSWETSENRDSLNFVAKVLPANWNPESLLTLGCGAGRLAIDIHLEYSLKQSYALDFNPFLLFVAKSMLSQKDLKFYELPHPTIQLAEAASARILKGPQGKPIENFQLLFGDIQNLPFNSNSFSAVLTPWVIDILPMDFSILAERINFILQAGGEWINFGPLGFMHTKESSCYTFEEIKEILQQKGFQIETELVGKIPYLNSPVSAQDRYESVILFRAIKRKDTSQTPYTYLPEWLINRDLPIPISPEIKHHQILAKTNADVFFTLDGKRSFNEISQLLAQHYQMPLDSANQTLMLLFIKFHESQIRTLK